MNRSANSQHFPQGEFEPTDEECLLRLREGDSSALSILFDRYFQWVFNIARRILRDQQEAEDLVQSVFLEMFRKASRFDPNKGGARSWILQYAYHRSFNRKKYLALRGYYRDVHDPDGRDGAVDPQIWGGLTEQEAGKLLKQALSTLASDQRRVLEKVFFQGYKLKEIAEEEGLSIGNVRHYYYRALEKLRRFMKEKTHTRG